MQELTFKQIAGATGGKCTDIGVVNEICTDTRKLTKGCLFVALKGENFDGHDFIKTAFEQGAAAVLSEQETDLGPAITVEDTGKALLDLAGYYRTLFSAAVVGITGSVGKTTTKEMVACVLSGKYKTMKTEGNFNNLIGLPMTLFRLENEYETAVIEMGMSAKGEISSLSKTAQPNLAIITNIGYSHIEFFGSREKILEAKLEILDGMEDNAPIILNCDDDLLCGFRDENREVMFYGIDNLSADVRAVNISENNERTDFEIWYSGNIIKAQIPTVGKHNVYNALAAFCAGILCNMTPDECVKALLDYTPAAMRQNIIKKGGQTVIVDCYNASPTSMEASLSVLSSRKSNGRKIAVLGDMLELGDKSKRLHEQIADFAQSLDIDEILCFGEQTEFTAKRAEELGGISCIHFDDKDMLINYLKETLGENDTVLVKGSRGMKLEEVIKTVWGEQ